MVDVSLHAVGRDGRPVGFRGELPPDLLEALAHTTRHYERSGFHLPWISYVGVSDGAAVGICAFKSVPVDGCVEIAYYCLPVYEGRGLATAMAAALVEIAMAEDASQTVIAQTVPSRGASHRILEKLGFRHVAEVNHPEDGLVWEWHRLPV